MSDRPQFKQRPGSTYFKSFNEKSNPVWILSDRSQRKANETTRNSTHQESEKTRSTMPPCGPFYTSDKR